MFNGQHYRTIAKLLAKHVGRERRLDNEDTLDLLTDIITSFSRLFAEDNQKFDSKRFIETCQNRE